jgi:hypothetical protein
MKLFVVLSIAWGLVATQSLAAGAYIGDVEWKSADQRREEAWINQGGIKVEKGDMRADDVAPHTPLAPQVIGLDFSNPTVDPKRIRDGGVVVDGIPAIRFPEVKPVSKDISGLLDDDYVIAVGVNGQARAYPLKLLNWHGVVNDELGGKRISVVWDAPSGAAMALERVIDGTDMDFGISGQVYQSVGLLYDRHTLSLWSPMEMQAITGGYSGTKLQALPVYLTYYKEFKNAFPKGTVVTLNTAYKRDYQKSPYGEYGRSKKLMFPVVYHSDALPRKEPVLGIKLRRGTQEVNVAFPVNTLLKAGDEKYVFKFGNAKIPLKMNFKAPTGYYRLESEGDVYIDTMYAYWFAWSAHNPATILVKDLP